MSSLLPFLPTAPVIRHFTELHSDPCCDKAEQVKREIETLIDLNLPEHLFMQLSGLRYICLLFPWEAELSSQASSVIFWFAAALPSSSRAVFLALAEVNHSTLTIFALPLYKRQGTRPTDPITSLSGNKCLTIQPYWVWKINPFHSRALPASFESREADVTVIIIVRHQISQQHVYVKFIGYFQGLSYFFSLFFSAAIVSSFCCSIFHIFVGGMCVLRVSQIIYMLPSVT